MSDATVEVRCENCNRFLRNDLVFPWLGLIAPQRFELCVDCAALATQDDEWHERRQQRQEGAR